MRLLFNLLILLGLVSAIDDVDCIINGIFRGIGPMLNRRYSRYHVTVSANDMVSTTGCIAALVLMPSMSVFGTKLTDCTILTDGYHLDLGIRKASITSESASDERRLA